MKHEIAAALAPLLGKVRTDARGVKKKGGKPYKEDKPLDLSALTHHSNGGPAYGAYPIRPGEDVCAFAAIDMDSHKGEVPFDAMGDAAARITDELQRRGLEVNPWSSSGGAGIHLVMVWDAPQDARSVRAIIREAIGAAGFADGAGGVAKGEVEVFPKQDRVSLGAYGNYIFLPGAFESVPLDDFTFCKLTKADIPGMTFRPSAPVPILPPEARPQQSCNIDADFDEVASAVCAIPNEGDALDYETWFRIVAGIHAADSGEAGHEIAEAWSEQSSKHNRAWFEHTWANLKADRADGVGAGTIFKLARDHGWDRYGDIVRDILESIDVEAAAQSAPDATLSPTQQMAAALPVFTTNRFGIAEPTLTNCTRALESSICTRGAQFGIDQFRDELMIAERPGQWRPVKDVDLTRMRLRFEDMQGGIPKLGKDIMRDAVHELADRNQFDSAMLWLDQLKWDGVPRCADFLRDYFGAADTPYTRATSLYLWSALAGRVIIPGVQADIVPVLVGDQGLFKSTAIAAMVPTPDVFGEINLDNREEDLARVMRGKLIVELAELKGLASRNIGHTKAFVTRRYEQWVPKYKEFATSYPRRCIIVGTTNEDDFLQDATGSRRFNPVRVARADRDGIHRDRDQLWAEARELFTANGVMFKDAETLAIDVHQDFTPDDPWAAKAREWMADRETPDLPFRVSDFLSGALLIPASQQHSGVMRRAASVLKQMGMIERRQYADDSKRHRYRYWATADQWKTADEVPF